MLLAAAQLLSCQEVDERRVSMTQEQWKRVNQKIVDVRPEPEHAVGATFGVDVPFGKGRWAFSAGLRYMKSRGADTRLDPVIVALGLAYRF